MVHRPLAPAGWPRHTRWMRLFPMIRRRWIRCAGLVFLTAWVPTAVALFASRRAWVDSRRLGLWADEMILPTVLVGMVALPVGLLIHDLLVLAGRDPEAWEADPQASDYDDRPTP